MPEYSGEYLGAQLEQIGYLGPLRRVGSHVYRRKVLTGHPSGREFALKGGVLANQISGAPELGRIRREIRLTNQVDLWARFLQGALDQATYDAFLCSLTPGELVPPAFRHQEEAAAARDSEQPHAPAPRRRKKQAKKPPRKRK